MNWGEVDISGIKDLVMELPEETWNSENSNKPNKFKEFHSTKHIIFKFVKSYKRTAGDSYEFPIWSAWKNHIQPLLDKAVAPYGYEDGVFSRIMLAKLEPKSQIGHS